MKTYHYDKYHFSINAPIKWSLLDQLPPGMTTPPEFIAMATSGEQLVFKVDNYDDPPIENWTQDKIDNLVSNFIAGFTATNPSTVFISSETTYINNVKFIRIEHESNNIYPRKSITYMCVHNNLFLAFYYSMPLKIYDENKPIIEKSINSLTFVK